MNFQEFRPRMPHHDDALYRRLARSPLTTDEIVDRAVANDDHALGLVIGWLAAALVISLLALYEPIHTYLHLHIGFFAGVAVGSWFELAMCEHWFSRAWRWLADRPKWLRWFSWQ